MITKIKAFFAKNVVDAEDKLSLLSSWRQQRC